MRSAISLTMALLVTLTARADEPKLPSLPESFSSFGAATADGYVYVYGGHVAKTHDYSTDAVTGKFRRLNLKAPASGWEELPAGPALQGLALVAHGGKFYRIGGMQPKNKAGDKADNHSVAGVAVYDPKTSRWSDLPDMPAGRSSHDAAMVGDLLVVVGGWDMQGSTSKSPYHDTALVLDLSAKVPTWKSVPQPFRRRALNVGAIGGQVYAVGGMTWENEVEKTVDAFDPKTGKWTTAPSLPGPIMNGFAAAVCSVGDKLYASPSDGKVYRLSDKAWAEAGALGTKRSVHRIVPGLGESLVALAGTIKAGNLSSVEAIEPACCEPKAAAGKAIAGQQQFCPIMTTVPIDEEARTIEYNGVTIKVCCATCVKKWKAEPEAYLNVAMLPQLKGMALPARKIEQIHCPVYADRVVSSKDPSTVYNGATIYFFNEAAKARFLADPAKYAVKSPAAAR